MLFNNCAVMLIKFDIIMIKIATVHTSTIYIIIIYLPEWIERACVQ